MANYLIPEEPVYNAEIRRLENSDPASADPTFNPLISRLIENTAAIKKDTDAYKSTSDGLGNHILNEDIHVNAEKQVFWTNGVQLAEKNARRITELELSIYSNIIKNPFSVGFDGLTGVKIVKGVWNKGKQRIEC